MTAITTVYNFTYTTPLRYNLARVGVRLGQMFLKKKVFSLFTPHQVDSSTTRSFNVNPRMEGMVITVLVGGNCSVSYQEFKRLNAQGRHMKVTPL